MRRLPERGAADKGTVPKMFLILCPTSVLHNWEQEFQAWGSFRVGIYHGVNRDVVLDKVHAHELEVRGLLCQGLFIKYRMYLCLFMYFNICGVWYFGDRHFTVERSLRV